MSYLGSAPSNQTPTYKQVYEYTATAGQTSFAASYTVGFVEVYRNGVKLGSSDFTATTGTTVVLASGATAGDFVQVVSLFINATMSAIPNTAGAVATANIADGNVTTAKIADGNITQAKLASNVVGTGPAFSAYLGSSQTIASPTVTKLVINTKLFDTASCFDATTNYRFTPNVAGYYQINFESYVADSASNTTPILGFLYKNGSQYQNPVRTLSTTGNYSNICFSHIVYMNGTTDYLEIYGQASSNSCIFYANSTFSGCLIRSA